MLHNVVVSSLMSKPIHHGTKTDIGDSTLLTQPGSHGRRARAGIATGNPVRIQSHSHAKSPPYRWASSVAGV